MTLILAQLPLSTPKQTLTRLSLKAVFDPKQTFVSVAKLPVAGHKPSPIHTRPGVAPRLVIWSDDKVEHGRASEGQCGLP